MRPMSLTAPFLALTTTLTLSLAQAQSFRWDAYKGTTLRVLLNQHPWTTAMQEYFPEFERLTGIKLETETYPEAQFRQKVLVELSTGGQNLDAFMLSPGQEGQLYAKSGWVEDMRPTPPAGPTPLATGASATSTRRC